MKINLVGVGMGNPALLTGQALAAVREGDCLIGASRLLELFADLGKPMFPAVSPGEIAGYLAVRSPDTRAVVLVSGDVGFYSLAASLRRTLDFAEVESFCGISSLQYFCARLNTAWDDAKVISLHGREQDLAGAVRMNRKCFVLTGGKQTVSQICRMLLEQGFDDSSEVFAQVGERLSYSDERITSGTLRELMTQTFDPLAVMLVQNPYPADACPVTHGVPDEQFLRGDAPMTKAEVRTVSIAKLNLKQGQTIWDVGAGTGSVAVEIARVLESGAVYAIERDAPALALLEQNRERFSTHLLRIVSGSAPQALESLPAPDAVFIGGSSGALPGIFAIALERNPRVRIVINAITLETVGAALDCIRQHHLCDKEIVQVSVAKAKSVGKSNMMMGQNPVYIISAGGGEPIHA